MMCRISIPFNEWSKQRLFRGTKKGTSRSKRYGEVGDIFEVDVDRGGRSSVIKFGLTHQVRLPLGIVAKYFFKIEGAKSQHEFVQVWKDIHPRAGFDPDKKVWLHLFKRLE